MRVLFWGTPEFATPPLRALLGEGFDVVGVVTQPDKPVGRSRSKRQPPPVKQVAVDEGLPVLQPEKPHGDAFLAQLRSLDPDISVVVAYGHILPQTAIDLPARGTLNIHASLLPEYRGAAPIQAALRDGLEWTGVSIMRMVQKLDAGPVILQLGTRVNEDETYGELSLRLSELGAAALVEALALTEIGEAPEVPQNDALATYAPKIDRSLTRVDWTQPAPVVARVIRAYDPKPGAFTALRGVDVKLFGARPASAEHAEGPGTVLAAGSAGGADGGILVACGNGAVRVVQVQPSGKKRMGGDEWVRGRGIGIGEQFD